MRFVHSLRILNQRVILMLKLEIVYLMFVILGHKYFYLEVDAPLVVLIHILMLIWLNVLKLHAMKIEISWTPLGSARHVRTISIQMTLEFHVFKILALFRSKFYWLMENVKTVLLTHSQMELVVFAHLILVITLSKFWAPSEHAKTVKPILTQT